MDVYQAAVPSSSRASYHQYPGLPFSQHIPRTLSQVTTRVSIYRSA